MAATRKTIYEIKPLGEDENEVVLHFHPGQQKAHVSKAQIVAVLAGTQSGKTSYGPWWLDQEIITRGAGDYLAVAPTYDLFKLKLLPELLDVFENLLGIGRYWTGDQVLEIQDPESGQFLAKRSTDKMWARVILRSASAKGGLESATANAAWLDEAGQDDFGLDAWEAIQRRVTLNQGRILITTTIYNIGWLKQKVYDPAQKGEPNIEVINFDSTLNPIFPKAEFEKAQARLPTWKFLMFYKGLYTRPAGMIYSDFVDKYKEEGGHKVKPFDIPKEWPVWVGVDPGANNTAKIWIAHDIKDNKFYLYLESLEGDKSTGEHATSAQTLASENQWNVVVYCVGQKSEKQIRIDWESAGVANVVAPPFPEIESQIDKVIELFKQHRLFIFDTCHGVLDEIGRYSRVLDSAGEPTEKIKDDQKFHHLAALRYVVVQMTQPPSSMEENWLFG